MQPIVPPGYAVPPQERQRLIEEQRQARAPELAKASEKDRARLEKEIVRDVDRKISKGSRWDWGLW
jgi:hypothetical protein